ncbi:MAG: hypothetical protein A2Z72_07385 [Omnitrophica bacterium RBG_13_46_9]|nr:MAG: hypothetical protein A2Z72_07385 [Omnitrophica bacterium RBG_13_46_9]
MQNREALFRTLLAAVTVFCIILIFAMFRHLKKAEFDFNDKKAEMIKENLDLKDNLSSLKERTERETKASKFLEEENKKLKQEYSYRVDVLTGENVSLVKKVKELEEKPLVERLKDALEVEQDEKVKEYLEKVLYNLVLIRSGKTVEADEPPIVTAAAGKSATGGSVASQLAPQIEESETVQAELQPLPTAGINGKIVSVDRKDNLIVVDLGRRDNINEAQRCIIIKDGKEIASSKIISVRYRVSAAFVDDIRYAYSMRNINEGDEVLVVQEE